MIRTLIVDDEPLSRRAVRQMCARHADLTVVAECRTGAEAEILLRDAPVDLMFLDVRMPGLSGLDIARRCEATALPLVVFVTAYDEFAVAAFDTVAIDYLTKPLNPLRFERALERVRRQLGSRAGAKQTPAPAAEYLRTLVVRSRDREILIPVDAVEYIAADDVYAEVHWEAGVHLVRQPLDLLERQLDPADFVRVHRAFIVRRDSVAALRRTADGGRVLVLHSGAEVPVSRRRRRTLQRLIT